ncbi:MAG: hypothetical protein IJV40_06060 [Oscillospiraceae bacterium]|nr:hypothetical protein [Oscillospiraceae bacterium]
MGGEMIFPHPCWTRSTRSPMPRRISIKSSRNAKRPDTGRSYWGHGSYRGDSYDGGMRSMGRGRNARRDAMGRYSSDEYSREDDGYLRRGDFSEQLRSMMADAPDERTRREIERLAARVN